MCVCVCVCVRERGNTERERSLAGAPEKNDKSSDLVQETVGLIQDPHFHFNFLPSRVDACGEASPLLSLASSISLVFIGYNIK